MSKKLNCTDWFFITVLLLFAAGLRITGISYGQPDPRYAPSTHPQQMIHGQTPMQPDEYLSVSIPLEMLVRGQLNPGFFEYPSFITYTNYFVFGITGAAEGVSPENRAGVGLREYAPFPLYVLSRMYSVFGGMLIVAAVYASTRLAAGRLAALSAALLAAVSFTLVQHSHYIKPGMLPSGFMMVAVWASFAALYTRNRRRRVRMYLLAGAFTGLATTTRYNAVSVGIILFLVGLVLLYRHRTRAMLFSVLGAWLLAPIVFVIGTPYSVLDFDRFSRHFSYITGQFLTTGSNVPSYFLTDSLTGLLMMYRFIFLFSLGIPAGLAILFGLYGAWKKRPTRVDFLADNSRTLYAAILLVFLLAYSFVVLRTIRPGHSDNLLVLTLPQFILLAGLGMGFLHERLPLPSRWLTTGLVLLLIVMPLVLSVQTVRMFCQPDTRYIMQDWVYEHLPLNSMIFLNGPYNVPLDAADYPSEQALGGYAESAENVLATGADYMIFSDAWLFDLVRSWEIVPDAVAQSALDYRDSLDEQFEQIAYIDRPVWTGSDWFMNMASYWHNPGLVVYCLHEASCNAVR